MCACVCACVGALVGRASDGTRRGVGTEAFMHKVDPMVIKNSRDDKMNEVVALLPYCQRVSINWFRKDSAYVTSNLFPTAYNEVTS